MAVIIVAIIIINDGPSSLASMLIVKLGGKPVIMIIVIAIVVVIIIVTVIITTMKARRQGGWQYPDVRCHRSLLEKSGDCARSAQSWDLQLRLDPRQTWSASLCIILNTVRISRETAAKTPQTWSAQLLYFCITAWITLCIVNQTHIWTHMFSYWKIEILKSSRRLADFWMLTNLAKLLGLMLDCCCQIDTCLIFFRHLQNTLLAFCILNDTCLIILTDAVTIPNAYILYNYESCKKGHWADSVPLFGMYRSNLRKFYKL